MIIQDIQVIQPLSGFGGVFKLGNPSQSAAFCNKGFGFSKLHVCPKVSLVNGIRSGQDHSLELDSLTTGASVEC